MKDKSGLQVANSFSENLRSKNGPADRNLKWAGFFALVIAFILSAAVVEAQPARKVFRIGLLSGLRPSPVPPTIEAFRQGLLGLGYIDGQNIKVEYRWAEGKDDRYAVFAAGLVGLGVDVILAQGTQAAIAAKQATNMIPIVVGGAGDLVGEGLVASLARLCSNR